MAMSNAEVQDMGDELVTMRTENAKLRELLAFQASGGAALYGDDGELQDNSTQPFIDFKCDSADEIEAKLKQRALTKWEERKLQSDQTDPIKRVHAIDDQIFEYGLEIGLTGGGLTVSKLIQGHRVLRDYRRRDHETAKAEMDRWRANVEKQARDAINHGEYIATASLQHMTMREIAGFLQDNGSEKPRVPKEVVIDYTNWQGVRAFRRILPRRLVWGSTEWHSGEGESGHMWLLDARDLDKQADRTFAVKDIHNWNGPFAWIMEFLA